ncbi:MAG: GNAT family N-acetyltransferase [Gemmatimonadetes bacterium]|nr:MAG: GNAT family N-acetyltransferase [Gemmatimonadota bacterium]
MVVEQLTPADYPHWDMFVRAQKSGSFFHTTQWLADRPEGEFAILGVREAGKLIAGFAYLTNHKWGLRRILPPKITSRFAPILADELLTQPDRVRDLLLALIKHLPPYDSLHLIFPPTMPDRPKLPLPNVTHQTLKTNRLYPPQTEESLRRRYSPNTRKLLNRAHKQGIRYYPIDDPRIVYRLSAQSMQYSGRHHPLTLGEFLAIFQRFEVGQDVVMLGAGITRQPLAAIMMTYDRQVVYPLFFGINRDSGKHEAGLYLMHHSIVWALEQNRIFDFNGSNIPRIDAFFQKFKPESCSLFALKHGRTRRIRWLNQLTTRLGKPLY